MTYSCTQLKTENMADKDYMRPLASISIDAVEALADTLHRYVESGHANTEHLSDLQKAVEFRIDALSVVGSTTEEDKRLVRALKRLKTDILQYE